MKTFQEFMLEKHGTKVCYQDDTTYTAFARIADTFSQYVEYVLKEKGLEK